MDRRDTGETRGGPGADAVGRVILAAVAVVLAGAGCFDPKIESGHLKCATAGKACPDGFTCASGLCVSGAPGAGGTGGATGTGGVGGGAGGTGGATTCTDPIQPLCTSAANGNGCDPVCQTGCGCGLRCSVSSSGTLCAAPRGTKMLGEICQSDLDDCAPGLACLAETCGTNLARCYRFCSDASMCETGSVCGTPIDLASGKGSGFRACNLGAQACDPSLQTGCPDPALKCYVTSPSQTTCDCPSFAAGMERQAGDSCNTPTDCAVGLWCLNVNGSSRCLRLCQSAADCAACTTLGSFKYCAQ